MPRYQFNLFADYFQFYLQDENAEGDLSQSWTDIAIENGVALASGAIGVGTVCDMNVPVTVEVQDSAPDEIFDAWDKVIECSLNAPSGRIVVAGCTDYFPDAARIEVKPGLYRGRVYFRKLDSLRTDGLDGNDHYKIVLWLAPPVALMRLK